MIFWALAVASCIIASWLLHGAGSRYDQHAFEAAVQVPQSPETALLFLKPLDINHVSLEGLETLPGIGRRRAEKMLQYRQGSGPFLHKDELLNLDNPIPPGVIDSLWPYLSVK